MWCERSDLEIVQLLGDLLASLSHKELLTLKDRGLELLEAKEARDCLKLAKQPLAQPIVLGRKVPGACRVKSALIQVLCMHSR